MIDFRKKAPGIYELEKRLLFDASLPAIAGQVLWLDADDTATVLDAEGDNAASGGAFSGSVQTWQDKSASGFHVTAAASTNRPTYSTGALNGNNVLTLDGGSDWLRNTGAVIGGDDYTMFVVFNRTTAAGRDAIFEMGGGGSRNGLFLNDASGANKINFYHNGTFYNPSVNYTTSAYTLSTATVNTNAYTLTQNGASVGSGTAGSNRVATTGIFVGNDSSGGDELQGNIAEILVYDRDLTADERHDVETYLAGKWGLTITNAAPAVSTNTGTTLAEGATTTITGAMLSATDADNTENTLVYAVTDVADNGTVFRDANSNNTIDVGEALSLNSTFTQGDIAAGYIRYSHNDSDTTSDAFGFTVTDQLSVTGATTFSLTINPVLDIPVTAGAVLWLDADDASTILDAEGDAANSGSFNNGVYTWVNKANPGTNNAVQTTLIDRPDYTGAGINSKGSIAFDGPNSEFLNMGSFSSLTAGDIFVVLKAVQDQPASTQNTGFMGFGTNSANTHYAWTDGNVYDDFGSTTRYNIGNLPTNLTQAHLYNVSSEAGSWIARQDGTTQFTSGANSVSFTTTAKLGSSDSSAYTFNGQIAEVIMFNRVLNGAERTAMQTYLNTKWLSSNTNPTISAVSDQTINEDGNTGALAFTVGDAETATASLTITATSSNTTLIPNGGVVLGGAGANRTITLTPDANLSGTTTITVTVDDGNGGVTTEIFDVNVTAVNDAPAIATNTGTTLNEGASIVITTAMLNEGDIDDSGTGLTYTASSLTNGHIEVNNVVQNTFTQADIDGGIVEFVHDGSETLSASFAFSLADGGEDAAAPSTGTFNLTVTAINDAPAIATNTGATMDEGDTLVITNAMLNEGDADDSGAGLTYTASNLVNGVIEVNNVVQNTFTQADIDAGLVEFIHNGGENIIAGFDVSLADGGEDGASAATGTFSITVTPVNDAPVIDGWSLVSSEDFQSGATGWANNTTTTGVALLTRYLGPFSNDGGVQSNSKTYALSGTQEYTVIEFDFYRMDSWDNEQFRIWINDTQVFGQAFGTGATTIADGSSGGVSWTASELTQISGNIAGGTVTWTDQIFRFTMTIQNSSAGTVKLGFGSTTNQATSDEAWGIDNVKIYEARDGSTPGPFTVAENTANSQVVAKITAGDVEGNAITYSITGGTGSSAFAINSSTGVITVLNSSLLNYETTTSFTLQITATDNGSPNMSDVETITINLVDVPENTAPTIAAAGPFSLAENAANNTVAGTMSATDAEGNTITWSITGGNTDNIFSINAAGQIRVNSNANLSYEWDNQYVLTIAATDNGFGLLSATRNVTINITNVNEAPTLDTATALLAADPHLRYNAATGNFYKLVSTAANYATATTNAAAQTLNGIGGHIATVTSAAENTYVRSLSTVQMWLGGSDSASEGTWIWAGSGTEGGVSFWQGAVAGSVQNSLYANWTSGTQPDNAGGGVGEDFMVMLTGAGLWNDLVGTGTNAYVIEWEGSAVLAAAAALNNGPYTIAENSAAGSSVGFLESFDIDAGDTGAYSATGGTGASLFNVNATTGEITVAMGATLNYEGTNSYTLDVRVQDAGGLFGTRTITINLSDVNETPILAAAGPLSFNENIVGGTSVTTMSGADVDGGQTLTYSLQSGNTGSMFAINSSTGEITFSGSPNYESVSSYNLVVRVTDNGTGSLYTERTVTVNINDVNETPTLAAGGPVNVFENTALGSTLLTMSGTDVDGGQTLTYTIETGNTGSVFAINSATGAITLAGAVDFETLALYNLVIRVTDNGTGSLYDERTVTFNIDDQNDAPTDMTLSANTVQENSSNGTVIGLLSTTDQELGQTHTYSLVNETTGRFTIVGNQLMVNGPIDYEQGATINLTLRADDGFGGTFDKIFTILVGDVSEYTAGYIAPDGGPGSSGFGGGLIEDDVRRLFEPEGGNFMRGVIMGGDAAQSEGFYGNSLAQIIRENVTMLMPLASVDLPQDTINPSAQEFQAQENTPETVLQDQSMRYTNIREALAALEAFQQQGKNGQQEGADYAHALYGQFEDVLSYHEKRQQRLREALR